MPIKPENASKYPLNWPSIRARILHRAGGTCEFVRVDGTRCEAPNRQMIARDRRNLENWWTWDFADAFVPPAMYSLVHIVLTVAHLNHDPADCRDENLLAGCQLHHLRYDLAHHQANAAATRRLKQGNAELFPDLTPQPVEVDTSTRLERI